MNSPVSLHRNDVSEKTDKQLGVIKSDALTTLMATRSEEHLEVVLTVLPAFKLPSGNCWKHWAQTKHCSW
uniref:Uncharacterized protein n=1 Tax=Oryzias melastigma TaxID=30732 RepID=A0A3B3CVE9_ORYME